MKMHIKYIGIVFLVVVVLSGKAQNTGFYWNQVNDSSNRLQGKLMGEVYFISARANSYFLYPSEWLAGSVTLTDGDTFTNMKLRLHVQKDELLAYNENNNALYFVEKHLVKSFTLEKNGNTQQFLKMKRNKEAKKTQYFELLYSGSQKLLGHRYIYEHKVSPYTDNMGVMRDTEYRMHIDYFVLGNNNSFQKILPKRISFLHAFPQHKKQIKKLFRKNDLFIDDIHSMIRAFSLMDKAGFLEE